MTPVIALLTGALLTGGAGAPLDPCTMLPIERIAGYFAEAGAPVRSVNAEGHGFASEQPICRYSFEDGAGTTVQLELEMGLAGADEIGECISLGAGVSGFDREYRTIANLGEAACMIDGGPDHPHIPVYLRFMVEERLGDAELSWGEDTEVSVPSLAARREITEAAAREWIRVIGVAAEEELAHAAELMEEAYGPSGEPPTTASPMVTGPTSAQPFMRITSYLSAQRAALGASGSMDGIRQQEGEPIAAWAKRLDSNPRISAAFKQYGFTPQSYLDFGIRFHTTWMAHKGTPTGGATDTELLAAIQKYAAALDPMFGSGAVSPWPGFQE